MSIAATALLVAFLSRPFGPLDLWDVVNSVRLAHRLRAIREAGEPLTLAELAKTHPDPPPGQNAARWDGDYQLLVTKGGVTEVQAAVAVPGTD